MIFYIGGTVEVTPTWGLSDVPFLTAVAGNEKGGEEKALDVYSGSNVPGQPWSCYRSVARKESDTIKSLEARLNELLTPSTAVADLQALYEARQRKYCPYLRLNQKPMDRSEWLVEGEMHNGAHEPLCVFTKNAGHRSLAAEVRRGQRSRAKRATIQRRQGGSSRREGESRSRGWQGGSSRREGENPSRGWQGAAAAEKGKAPLAELQRPRCSRKAGAERGGWQL